MTDHEKAVVVIKACLARGIREFVVCSGARNIALISALTQHDEVVVW